MNPLSPELLDFLRRQTMPPGSATPPPAPPPEPQGAPPPPPNAPAASDVAPPPDPLGGYMAAIKDYVGKYASPDALAAAQQRDRGNIESNRLAQGMANATGLMINNPGAVKIPEAVPLEVRQFMERQALAEKGLGMQAQFLQMAPGGPLAEAQRKAYNDAGFNFPPGTPPMVMDAAVKAKRAGGEASLPGAQAAAATAGAQHSAAETANIPVENQLKLAGLQKDYDLKAQEILAAAKQGDLNRANELAKQRLSIEAEMTRLRANIASENVGDSDWEIGPQFSGGIKKLSPAAQEVLKKSPGARALLDNSARAEELLNKHPNGVVTGDDAANLHRWLSEMTAQLNGIWGMGILRQNNMPMLEEALQDPTSITSILKNKAKGVDFRNQLHQFQTMVKQRMYSEGTATGALQPKAGGYYEGFQSVSGKDAGSETPTVVETRVAADGRKLEKLSDGSIRVAK